MEHDNNIFDLCEMHEAHCLPSRRTWPGLTQGLRGMAIPSFRGVSCDTSLAPPFSPSPAFLTAVAAVHRCGVPSVRGTIGHLFQFCISYPAATSGLRDPQFFGILGTSMQSRITYGSSCATKSFGHTVRPADIESERTMIQIVVEYDSSTKQVT